MPLLLHKPLLLYMVLENINPVFYPRDIHQALLTSPLHKVTFRIHFQNSFFPYISLTYNILIFLKNLPIFSPTNGIIMKSEYFNSLNPINNPIYIMIDKKTVIKTE